MELTVADINEINRRLSAGLDYGSGNADPDAIKAVADLQWKLVFLGQQIEQAGKRRVPVPAPAPAWQPMEPYAELRRRVALLHAYSSDDFTIRHRRVVLADDVLALLDEATHWQPLPPPPDKEK